MVSCQFSIYPLGVDDLSPAIDRAIEELQRMGLEVQVGSMSTYVTGDIDRLFEGLRNAFEIASQGGHVVMTATVSNACPVPPLDLP